MCSLFARATNADIWDFDQVINTIEAHEAKNGFCVVSEEVFDDFMKECSQLVSQSNLERMQEQVGVQTNETITLLQLPLQEHHTCVWKNALPVELRAILLSSSPREELATPQEMWPTHCADHSFSCASAHSSGKHKRSVSTAVIDSVEEIKKAYTQNQAEGTNTH